MREQVCNSVGVPLTDDRATRVSHAADSLCGVRVGDALGEKFFGVPEEVNLRIAHCDLPTSATWTDDTLMASSLATELVERSGLIDSNALLESFATHFDIRRGYGHLTMDLLHEVRMGGQWEHQRSGIYGGTGSWGNGAAMRVAPLGAYWYDDLNHVAATAREQARVTHTHPEAAEGAVAIAIAAAIAAASRGGPAPSPTEFLEAVVTFNEPSKVRDGLTRAIQLVDTTPTDAAMELGSGREVAAFDTVPFALWSASRHLDDYEGGFWSTVAGLGDRDTTCAMAGGVIAARVGAEGIPLRMRSVVEPLPSFTSTSLQR
jgi:ADP-ribosylglycohydrolase